LPSSVQSFTSTGRIRRFFFNRLRDGAAYKTANQSIPSGAYTTVTWGVENYDRGADLTAATGVFTVPEYGLYEVMAAVVYSGMSSGTQIALAIFNNGVQKGTAFDYAGGASPGLVVCDAQLCNASDTLDVRAYQGSGANKNLTFQAEASYLFIKRIA
jgi:hypothetical protein